MFPELLESSLLILRHVLELLEISEEDIDSQIDDYVSALPANIRRTH